MTALIVIVFIVTYAAIAFEVPLKINKSATALIGAGLLWTLWALSGLGSAAGHDPRQQLSETLIGTAEITFFLMGAMTVVEVIDTHGGFEVVTRHIRAQSLVALIWIVCAVTFMLSAILDNLTTTIVMVSLVRQLVAPREDRLYLAGLVVIAANAGGAWSPMGDVTTSMLWIGGQVTGPAIVTKLFVPSLVNLAAPLAVVSWVLRGRKVVAPVHQTARGDGPTEFERNLVFALGLGLLLAVPAFKAVTHLPPWLGILLGLGLLWAAADFIHREKEVEVRRRMVIADALTRIDPDRPSGDYLLCRHSARSWRARTRWSAERAGRLARYRNRPARCDCTAVWAVLGRGRQCPDGGSGDGDVSACAVSDRQFLVGVHGLLRRNRRIDPNHRLGGGGSRDEHRKDRILLVFAQIQFVGVAGLFGWGGGLSESDSPAGRVIRQRHLYG